jgi:hypothetical protein
MAYPLRMPLITQAPTTPRKGRGQRSALHGLPVAAATAALATLALLLWALSAHNNPPSLRWDPSPTCLEAIDACNAIPDLTSDVVCALLTAARPATLTAAAASPPAIPRLLHQSWKTADIPIGFRGWAATWQRHHPNWERHLWSDVSNRRLVAQHYPWLLSAYDAMPAPIFRADIARALYMHRFGGIYADLDTVCLRPLDHLLDSAVAAAGGAHVAVLAQMSADEGFEHNVPNAWMASTPGHPFWLFMAGVIERRTHRGVVRRLWEVLRPPRAEYDTGPVILKQALDTWQCVLERGGGMGSGRRRTKEGEKETAGVVVLPPGRVFVGDWHNETALSEYYGLCGGDEVLGAAGRRRCLAAFPYAHVLTYWTRTWYT